MKRFEEEFEELWKNAERETWSVKPAHQDVAGETGSQDDLGLGGRGTQLNTVAGVSSASVTDTATGPSGTGVVTRTGDDPDRGHDEVDGLDLRRHECIAWCQQAGQIVTVSWEIRQRYPVGRRGSTQLETMHDRSVCTTASRQGQVWRGVA